MKTIFLFAFVVVSAILPFLFLYYPSLSLMPEDLVVLCGIIVLTSCILFRCVFKEAKKKYTKDFLHKDVIQDDWSFEKIKSILNIGTISSFNHIDSIKKNGMSLLPVIIFCLASFTTSVLSIIITNYFNANFIPNNDKLDWVYAIIVAIISGVLGMYYTNRVNSRTSYRIEWSNKLRDALSQYLSKIDRSQNKKYFYIAWREDAPLITYQDHEILKYTAHVELMLDPFQPLHRVLIALMRLQAGLRSLVYDTKVLERTGFHTDSIDELNNIDKYEQSNRQDQHYQITEQSTNSKYCVVQNDSPLLTDDLISYIFYLSSIVLLREWEKIKNLS